MRKPIPFGKYYLLERINVGGMAEVFRAKAFGVEGFERIVAVKRILPQIAEDEEFIKMFVDEAKIVVQLNHANIAQIFDLGVVDGAYYIALEHIHGRDLRAIYDRVRLEGEKIPVAQACFIMMKVCEGLDYAHNKKDGSGRNLNLVHRDVSPQNILVSFEGGVKLIDFGIAKAAGKGSQTQAGILKGKFGYMSPEQVRGLPIDRRSDVFACGIVLYELLTGERLFVGESDFATLEKVRNVEILPPSTYNPKIPSQLERIILKALTKDPEDRYQNAIDLHDELQAFAYEASEFCSRKELAEWIKEMFSAELEAETAKLESYQKLTPIGTRRPTTAPPPIPDRVRAASKPPEPAQDDLDWDEEELETNIYDDQDAVAAVAGMAARAKTSDPAPAQVENTDPTLHEWKPPGNDRLRRPSTMPPPPPRPKTEAPLTLDASDGVIQAAQRGQSESKKGMWFAIAAAAVLLFVVVLVMSSSGKKKRVAAAEVDAAQIDETALTDSDLQETGIKLFVEPAEGSAANIGELAVTQFPSEVRFLQPGNHTIQVTPPPGYEPAEKSVEVTARNLTEVRIALKRKLIAATFTSQPPGAMVTLEAKGQAPQVLGVSPAQAQLDPTLEYSVIYKMDGYNRFRRSVQIIEGQVSRPHATLRKTGAGGSGTGLTVADPFPTPPKQDPPKQDPPKTDPPKQDPPKSDPPKPAYGFVTFSSKPPTKVFVDGEYKGWTPKANVKLKTGTHRIEFLHDDFKKSYTLRVKPGKNRFVKDLSSFVK